MTMGGGFLKDKPVGEPLRDLDEEGITQLKEKVGVKYIGRLMDFVSIEHLFDKYPSADAVPEREYDLLRTSWEGKPLLDGILYCVVTDDDEGGAPATSAAAAMKKAIAMKIEDKVVAAEGDKLFAAKAAAEARKNVAQMDKAEGGVWGVKRRGPSR
jgi:hypothetical protein